jgi:broad specificity phosphatase PhoE
MAIVLIRHGETPSNAARIVQTPDTPLSPRGVRQAERLGRRLAQSGATRILSSDLTRALMTAGCLHAETGAPVSIDSGLQERNFGDLRGRAYADLGFNMFAPDYVPPRGEGWGEFHARVDAVWQRVLAVAQETDGNLLVVTHGLVCYSLALRHLRLPAGVAAPERWENTSVTIVANEPPWPVSVLNCTEHLDEEIAADPSSSSGS